MDQSKQALRDIGDNANLTCASSLKEITLIETVTSFLEENGAAEIDRKVLRTLAEALSKSVDDSTSPGVLQDVTMDNSYASFDAGRLQGDSHSPLAMPGRSMRNVEEQMSSLRKENFNLKLRLYFMEESQLGHQRTNHSGESLSKQLIDAKIEAEVLRKTVEEKTELLKDAARAISLHEEMQRKAETESQALIDELQQHLRHYEETENAVEGDTRAVLEEKLKQLDAEVLRLRQELVEAGLRQIACQEKLKSAQAEHQETLSSCEAKIEELAIKNAELVEQIEKDTQCSGQTNAKQEMDAQLADNMCELQDAQEKLKERERIHEQACRTIQKLMQKLSSQDKEIKRLNQLHQQPDQNSVKKEEENSQASISPLASSGRSLSDNEACSLEISAALKEQYEHTMAEQELKIKQLQAEVKKKTANLQNLVNKELWEKNREVERLTNLVAANQQQQQQPLPEINEDCNGSMDLQQSFTEVEYTKALERNKLLQRKVDVLIHRLGEDQQNSAVIGQLRQELRQVQADAESANKWRLECADVCGVLTNRLEELAGFLNSLLKHKDVLGALAADRRHAMRRAVDRSLDLSKSLNMTLNITGTSLADQSLAQLCNLSEMLYTDADADADADAEADASHKTYNSHEEIRAAASAGPGAAISPTLEHLKAENKALKRELEKRRSTDGQQQRKERRSLPLPMQQLDNQSESEAWSEPDRKVSLARIGLEETSHSLATAEHRASESESEGRRACSARQERSRHSERIAQLEEQIAQRDERVLNVQCQMVDLDNRYKQEQLRCMEISQQMEQLRAVNEALKADLQAIGTQEDQQMDELQRLVELKTKQIDQLELAKSTLTADAQVTDMELQAAQQQLLQMEQEHAVAVDQAQAELAQLKLEAAQKLEEVQRLHQEALERDWVALSIYQEQTRELLELQRSLEYHQENEIELKQTLVENELATRALKKQLDESTLQASKAVMERTKAYNEKLQLEKRTEELRLQLELLKNGQQQQQRQPPARSNSSDVSQSGYTSEEVAVPMGPPNGIHSTVPANMAVVVGRMNSSSPDLGIESDAGRISSVDLCPATQRAIHTTVELHNDTLSGVKDGKHKGFRFVKGKNLPLNLCFTEPVSPDTGNALNVSQQQQQPSAAATIAHDCAKVDQENAELRRKLIRTKRAFEDTYEKLRLANKAKAQVEKDIKNQILKTHNVLRNVRSNMENEL
ncbi:LOW QUALITY PROTEIN: centrosomin [Drosophila subobscura]|uniref:LOW QUALITY PROTEIN: centrosomin n=1 Tax=Drosophila subobscura TaxID=7241 RepID=UPI00155AE877|nr:LOW QUALITY PROTEIN: centrosomin [Drosophila subobscura]